MLNMLVCSYMDSYIDHDLNDLISNLITVFQCDLSFDHLLGSVDYLHVDSVKGKANPLNILNIKNPDLHHLHPI